MTASAASPRASVSALPFVGRESELARLTQCQQDAAAGLGQLVLLSGDGGVGKSRLLAESIAAARASGWQVAHGQAYPLETAIPYAVFADAMAPLLATLDSGALMRLTRGDRAILAALAPDLLDRGSGNLLAEGVNPAEQRVRLHTAIRQLLTRLSEKTPLYLCLENLQWADSASVELLHFLGRQVASQRLIIVACWNETDRTLPDEFRLALRSLRSLGGAVDVRLTPLTQPTVKAVLAAHFGVSDVVVDAFATRLHQATLGNAFFLDQVLRELVSRGDVRQQGGVWVGWHVETLTLPPSVRDVLADRLARLGAPARRLAEIIAVADSGATHDVVRTVARMAVGDGTLGLDDAAIFEALRELRDGDIITERPGGDSVVYAVVHPMMQQALVESVGLARERELHATLARAMEAVSPQPSTAQTETIAVHWLRADPREQPAVAVRWLVAAGRQALLRLARREAAELLRAALDRADAHPEVVPANTRDDLVDDLMRVYRRLGDYQQAIAMCKRAIEHATATGNALALAIAERRYALSLTGLGRREEALAHYDAAIAHARRAGSDSLVIRTQLAKGDAMQMLGLSDDAKREVADAVATAESLGDISLQARAHRILLMLHVWTGPAHRAWSYARSAVQLAEKSGERNLRWHAHFGAAVLGGLTSQTQALATHLEQATRLAQELASPLLELRCAEIALEYRAGIGQWDRALAEGEGAITLARALDQTTLRARILHWVSGVYLQRGDIPTAQRLVQEAWEVSGAAQLDHSRPFEVHGVLPAFVARTRYLEAVGERAEALRVGQIALDMAMRTGYVAWAVYRLMPTMIEAALALGDTATVDVLRQRLEQAAAHLAHPIGRAWVEVIDGERARAAGDFSTAIAHLQRAIAQLEAVPYPFDAAKARLRLARVYHESGARDDAVHEAREALTMFDQVGAAPAATDAREILRELGARLPVAPDNAAGAFADLTARELEIVKLVAQRLSNKEIGARLGITARTAGTHLANIFDKVGVRDRTGLGDLAREKGLLR
ncbi:MAG: AAA family ATPase [Gemmatimonadaceae bacterium]|nr:AAA family ATPase [Gemmatimonadaceae bacterium]